MRKIVIENNQVTIEKNEKYPETEILADLLCSASAVAKDVGVSKGMLLDCLMTAWDESNYQEMIS